MPIDSRKTLWANLLAWMCQKYGEENLNRLSRESGIAIASIARIKAQQTSVGLELIDKLAQLIGCHPYQLIQRNAELHPRSSETRHAMHALQSAPLPARTSLMSNQTRVRKAVFPVAGLGTRFLPATKASPKEMLPVVDKPLIQYAVEEAYEAGIRDMIFVTGRSKRAIEDHFDTAYELENELERAGKQSMLNLVHSIAPADMNCLFVRQPRSLGLGHAVLCAEPLVGDEPFAVILADDLMRGEAGGPGVMKQMTTAFQKQGRSLLAVQEVPLEHTKRYGIVKGEAAGGPLMRIDEIVEKPAPEKAPSRMGVAGRYVLTPRIFEEIRNQPTGVGGEIQLTDAIERLMQHETVYAFQYAGKRYDCGSKEGFLQATVELALQHPDVGDSFREYLKNMSI